MAANKKSAGLFKAARKAIDAGKLSTAEKNLGKLLGQDPSHVEGRHQLARLRIKQRKPEEAIRVITALTAKPPLRADFLVTQAEALMAAGRLQEAANAARQAMNVEPGNIAAYRVLGEMLLHTGQWQEAAGFLKQALEVDPRDGPANAGLAQALTRLGHHQAAVQHFAIALEQLPRREDIRAAFGWALYAAGAHDRSIEMFESLTSSDAFRREAMEGLAAANMGRGRPESALGYAEQALEEFGTTVAALGLKGHALNALGDTKQALAVYRAIIEMEPSSSLAWYQIAQTAPKSISDAELTQIESLAREARGEDQARLEFAAAEAYAAREQWQRQLEALHRGNAVRRSRAPYDPGAEESRDQYLKELFTAEFLAEARQHGDDAVAPIFILGMPRSGTTLTEQILASHSQVEATGESIALAEAFGRLAAEYNLDDLEILNRYPLSGIIPKLARQYLDVTRESYGVESEMFTDKGMINYRYAPVLAAAFPNARFIHVSREPMDVCFGCYRKMFSVGQYFSNDLAHCAHFYARFEALVNHWRRALGIEMHHLQYENLVADQEGETRRLLDAMGLPFEKACLQFHRTERAVVTASQNQVREKLNQKAVGRWQRYGEGLKPLREALERYGVSVDD